MAYFAKKPSPAEIPNIVTQKRLLLSIILISAKRLNDQNNNKGVSVEIKKLPKLVAGRVIQMIAVKLPAFGP